MMLIVKCESTKVSNAGQMIPSDQEKLRNAEEGIKNIKNQEKLEKLEKLENEISKKSVEFELPRKAGDLSERN